MSPDHQLNHRMEQRYLLATQVSFARDTDGRIWLDELWWRDLSFHLTYLENLTVLAPCQRIETPQAGMVQAVTQEDRKIEFIEIFPYGTLHTVMPHLLSGIWTTWKVVGDSDLVHSGVAGWPIPVGAIVNLVAVLRRKPLIIIIESAFWRLQPGSSESWKARLRAWLTEHFAKWSMHQSTLGVYTHAGYRESLPVGRNGTSAVLPASWILERDIISFAAAEAAWDNKPTQPRFLMASRLERDKGIPFFLEILHRLDMRGKAIELDVIGSGSMRPDIERFSKNAKSLKIRLLEPVPYGLPFMQLLRAYHGTIVPLTGDEQARILYDSFSQAVPVIATDTFGNREVVTDGDTGFLFPVDDPEAFADAVTFYAANPAVLRKAGLSALSVAANYTHADMHRKRAELLNKLFGTNRANRALGQ